MSRFDECLPLVLAHEGGKVNHPKDPGGRTNMGVTQAVYDQFRRDSGLPVRDVWEIGETEVRTIYHRGYWLRSRCDALPPGVDYSVFDAAVNSGPRRAAEWLQEAAGAKVDGIIGPDTLRRVAAGDPKLIVNTMCDARMDFLRRLPTWGTFGRGWTRRVDSVRLQAALMAETKKAPPLPPPVVPAQPSIWAALARFIASLFRRPA